MIRVPPIRFDIDETQWAADDWGFNCGPAALCAVLGRTPAEIRPHLGDFEQKGYTNPRLMAAILRGLRIPFRRVYECPGSHEAVDAVYPAFGLVRIQWGGPWTKSGVPVRVRYRHTHWIAMHNPANGRSMVFDVNAMCVRGWIDRGTWAQDLVPWLLGQCVPQADGRWWPTHCWEILNG